MPRRAPSQVTVFETVIELENITTTQNVSFLVNNTVRYNATYNISYDVSRNVCNYYARPRRVPATQPKKHQASKSMLLDEASETRTGG